MCLPHFFSLTSSPLPLFILIPSPSFVLSLSFQHLFFENILCPAILDCPEWDCSLIFYLAGVSDGCCFLRLSQHKQLLQRCSESNLSSLTYATPTLSGSNPRKNRQSSYNPSIDGNPTNSNPLNQTQSPLWTKYTQQIILICTIVSNDGIIIHPLKKTIAVCMFPHSQFQAVELFCACWGGGISCIKTLHFLTNLFQSI